jgi:transposase
LSLTTEEVAMADLFWRSDESWAAIEPHLPHGKPGKPRVDDRRVISGILHVLKTGCRWRDVPSDYGAGDHRLQSLPSLGPARHLAARVRNDGGSRTCARRALAGLKPCEGAPLGANLKEGAGTQAIGPSRGGRTSKIHALADDQGRPVAFALTQGNVADISVAIPLLEGAAPSGRLIADKAYDADSLRNWLRARGIEAVIPSNATRRTPYPLDRMAHRRRNVIVGRDGHASLWGLKLI